MHWLARDASLVLAQYGRSVRSTTVRMAVGVARREDPLGRVDGSGAWVRG